MPPQNQHATIRDVARRAGVSIKTVSNVLNGFPAVAPTTRARVDEAIAALEYRRNGAARSLRTQQSHTVGLILTSLANPFYAEFHRGVQEVADTHGYAVIVGTTEAEPRRQEAFVELLLEQRVDGVIYQSIDPRTAHLDPIIRAGMPLVAVGSWSPDLACDQILTDDERGAYDATTHLIALGHRRIGHLAGPIASSPGEGRLHGYRRALEAGGFAVDSHLIVHAGVDRSAGRLGVSHLSSHGIAFTAIFAANDLVAFGALDALRRSGRRVPDDVSLVGFDDLPEASEIDPPLTTVLNPSAAKGSRAAELLFERIGGFRGESRHITLGTELVVRASTSPARAPASGESRAPSVAE